MKAFIVDFQEPADFVRTHVSFVSRNRFLLKTRVALSPEERVRVRFNLPDGNGVAIQAKVVGAFDDYWELLLPENLDTKWLKGKGEEYTKRFPIKNLSPEPPGAFLGFSRQDGVDAPGPTAPEAPVAPPAPPRSVGKMATTPVDQSDFKGPQRDEFSEEVGLGNSPPTVTGVRPGLNLAGIKPEPAASNPPKAQNTQQITKEPTPPVERPEAPSQAQSKVPSMAAMLFVSDPKFFKEEDKPAGAPAPGAESKDGDATAAAAGSEAAPTGTDAGGEAALRKLAAKVGAMSSSQKKQVAISGGPRERSILIQDADPSIQIWVLKNPDLAEAEVRRISRMTTLSKDALDFLLSSRKWSTMPSVALNLLLHPATPQPAQERLLTVLPTKVLMALSQKPGVVKAIADRAKEIMLERKDY